MERAIADAMILAGQKHCSKPGNVYITRPVMKGAYIVRADPPFHKAFFAILAVCKEFAEMLAFFETLKYYFERSRIDLGMKVSLKLTASL